MATLVTQTRCIISRLWQQHTPHPAHNQPRSFSDEGETCEEPEGIDNATVYKIEPEHIGKVSAPHGPEDTGMIDGWCMMKENTMRMTMMTTTWLMTATIAKPATPKECLALPKQQRCKELSHKQVPLPSSAGRQASSKA